MKTKITLLASLALLFVAPLMASAATCSTPTVGTIQADDTIASTSPRLGDVYAIRWTNAYAGYTNDDEGASSTIVLTAPDGIHTITVGVFQNGAGEAEGSSTNPFGANIAAGFSWASSTPTWVAGTWTWVLNFADGKGNTCTWPASGSASFTVLPTWNPAHGFLRSCAGNGTNLCTDGDGAAFFGTGGDGYPVPVKPPTVPGFPAATNNYTQASLPAHMTATVNGTSLIWRSGTQFSPQTQPSGLYPYITLCTALSQCTTYWDITINSATSATLPTSGGNGTVDAWQGWERDVSLGGPHASVENLLSLPTTAAVMAQYGYTLQRFAEANSGEPEIVADGNLSNSGANLYLENSLPSTTGGGGLPQMDAWFAAEHAAGIHIYMDADNGTWGEICPTYVCNASELSALENSYAMVAARYGAFSDVWEFENEQVPPKTWVDEVAATLKGSVPGLVGDPYLHLLTVSQFPANPSDYTGGTNYSDSNLNLVALPHDNANATHDYQILSSILSNPSGGQGGGCTYPTWVPTSTPRFNGESDGNDGTPAATATATAPNPNLNTYRLYYWGMGLNQCSVDFFGGTNSYLAYFSASPSTLISDTFTDFADQQRVYQNFMLGSDGAMSPISFTVGGLGSNSVTTSGLGSTKNVRLVIDNAASASTISGATLSGLTVPSGCGFGEWWNPQTGTTTPMSIASSEPWTIPNFNVDIAWRCEPSPAAVVSAVAGD